MKYILLLFLGLILLPSTTHADITTGLVGWWKFDEGSGSTAIDSSGSGNNGSEQNGPTYIPGKIGPYALSFDGSTQNVSMPSFNFGNTFTIAMWALANQSNSGNTPYTLVSNASAAGAQQNGFEFSVNSYTTTDGSISFNTGDGTTSAIILTGTGVWTNNTWHHVAVVVNKTAGTAIIYLDGSAVSTSGSNLTDYGVNQTWIIGSNSTDPRFHWPGYLDEVRVYNRALSSSDIRQLYFYPNLGDPRSIINNAKIRNAIIN